MQGRLKVEEPEKIVYVVTLSASVKEWEELRDQLSEKWPSSRLNTIITDLLSQARKIYWVNNDAG